MPTTTPSGRPDAPGAAGIDRIRFHRHRRRRAAPATTTYDYYASHDYDDN